jgi:hypothetical protein
VHHALRARFCIERGRYWHAEYWIGSTRDYALNLACLQRDLPTAYGRGFDDLPAAVHERFVGAFANSLERDELLRALTVAVEGLLHEASDDLAVRVDSELRTLMAEWPNAPAA